ncbi:MAG: endolytic transglycosylase MltG, partial [Elusimicrobia bacterium]|nr:endolytic transglycosylase MltG [Elusimicrobiota bacterium]MBD3412399.1 endolytic transglycosylase MltG [Elusimicrobiota bacterium]
FTVPEGLTMKQVAQTLAEQEMGDENRFMSIFKSHNREGYLFPETYVIAQGLSEQQIADILYAQFERTFNAQWKERAAELGMSVHEIVTLASLIEKEAKVDHERPLISAVFHNRLKSHKYLESCATVQYALGQWKKRLSLKDLEVDSPYNTYKHYGLPPGPICSPGRQSLYAALYPEDTDALFFISNGDGTHSFYTRYRDHLKGKKEYKKMIQEYRQRIRKKPYQ